jgi:hypothetical protein
VTTELNCSGGAAPPIKEQGMAEQVDGLPFNAIVAPHSVNLLLTFYMNLS